LNPAGQAALTSKQVFFKVLRLGRVKLPAVAYTLFLFGVLLAASSSGARFAFDRFAWGSAIVLAAVLSVNYGNDYFDTEVDRLNETSPISGGSGVLLKNPELMYLSKWIAICLMTLSIALAVAFVIVFRFPLFFIALVVLGNGLVWFYSAPPLRLSYRGLGEITTMLEAGLILPCTGYFIMLRSLDSLFWIFSFPVVLYALSVIVSVEAPDMEGDGKGGKYTLVVRRGRRFGFALVALCNLLATLYLSILSESNLTQISIDLRLIAVFSLAPLAMGILGLIERTEDRNSATRLATFNVYAISFMLLITDCYFIATMM
jgi:1,4-dihydroxy-2-naphthoate octaprenyltransferase